MQLGGCDSQCGIYADSLHAQIAGFLSARRAAKLEDATKSARLAEYRNALAAPGESRVATPRAPSRVAFRYVRGLCSWARTPVGNHTWEDGVPDADDLDDAHESAFFAANGAGGLISMIVGSAATGAGGSIIATAGSSSNAAGGAVTLTSGISSSGLSPWQRSWRPPWSPCC